MLLEEEEGAREKSSIFDSPLPLVSTPPPPSPESLIPALNPSISYPHSTQTMPQSSRQRPVPEYDTLPDRSNAFKLNKLSRNYAAQYSNVYFSRLFHIRPHARQRASDRWDGIKGHSHTPFLVFPTAYMMICGCSFPIRSFLPKGEPKFIERVLDVQQGQLCYVVGTIYMDMPLKPNVLEDISKDVRLETRITCQIEPRYLASRNQDRVSSSPPPCPIDTW